jgi:myo-inositol-1(or 4)-monophosphatase
MGDGLRERDLRSWNIVTGRCSSASSGGVTDADGNSDLLTRGSICSGDQIIHLELLTLLNVAA